MSDPVVAVLGGGQLGRMLALAAAPLGVRCRFLDPKADAPARDLGPLVIGALDDADALTSVVDGATVATYEWEGVPASSARLVAGMVPIRPGAKSLEVSQDRKLEKDTFRALDIPTAQFAIVDDRATLDEAVHAIGLPAVLKTRRGGYDGKGQAVLRDDADVDAAWSRLGDQPLLLEQWIAFERELSVIATRDADGHVVAWPLVENVHENGTLRTSRAPATATGDVTTAAHDSVRKLLDQLDHVGTLALELFDTGDALLANELAPRVHNTGHWTIEGAVTSQFENHIRAVLGLPLGETTPVGHCAMVNFLGGLPDPADVMRLPRSHFHDYRKSPAPGRKVGHATLVADDPDALETPLSELLALAHAASASLETP
jgi:5-(carboxyamino)imidazole ribonucleotide synthase